MNDQRSGMERAIRFKEIVRRGAPPAQDWLYKTHPAFLRFIPALSRNQLETRSLEYWPEVDTYDRAGEMAVIDSTAGWIINPLFTNQ